MGWLKHYAPLLNERFEGCAIVNEKANIELLRNTSKVNEATLIAMIFTMRLDENDPKSKIIYFHEDGCTFRDKEKLYIENVVGRVKHDLRMKVKLQNCNMPAPNFLPFWVTWPKGKYATFDLFLRHMIEDSCKKYMRQVRDLRKDLTALPLILKA